MRNRVAGRAINAALAGVLLERRRSQVLRGFRSKAGKSFAAALVLDDSGELRFDFGDGERSRRGGEPVELDATDHARAHVVLHELLVGSSFHVGFSLDQR